MWKEFRTCAGASGKAAQRGGQVMWQDAQKAIERKHGGWEDEGLHIAWDQ